MILSVSKGLGSARARQEGKMEAAHPGDPKSWFMIPDVEKVEEAIRKENRIRSAGRRAG
jgi:hypothetical protein